MKLLLLILALNLTACGTDDKPTPTMEVTLPATFSEGTILTSGATIGDQNCSTTWPKVMPYEVDGAGTYHVNGKSFEPVEGQDRTWTYAGERVNDWLAVTTFTVGDDSVTVRLNCYYQEPIEHAL